MTTTTLNSLARASSAYLRSAMHQPIQWHEWNAEAFAKAKEENKPILLDIGAVWCHWCHVMDRESYDNPEIAQLVNERFIAIKVDRDERPDIDIRYQSAVSAVSGQGGWPLTAFLTPDGIPFYGGTYFPPEDHYGRPSFKRVLTSISDAYREKHSDVTEQARMVESTISQSESLSEKSSAFSTSVIADIVKSALDMFDENNGGFGNAPKFPHPAALDLLIDQYARSKSGAEQLREPFVTTLEKMARGGVYDQLAGGFHRYSVDERWIVPHFEKMSYDNSELLKNYVHAFQATGSEFFAAVARDIIRWMDEWLSDREAGGFYASQDADFSMDDDGDYFTWSVKETDEVLTEEESDVAKLHYDINEVGEMHHNPAKNVLYVRASLEEISRRLNLPLERVHELLTSAKEKMYAARLNRPTPYVDKTIYAGWNALCVSAYLEAAKVLDLSPARHFALRSLDRILAQAWGESGLHHVVAYSDSTASGQQVPGMLDDYAFTTVACLDAYEATSDITYFNFAQKIGEAMIQRFFDESSGGFFDTGKEISNSEKPLGVLAMLRKPFQDSPTPAGNPVAAIALFRLYSYTNHPAHRQYAERTMELLGGVAGRYGIFAATYAIAGIYFLKPHIQVVILGEDAKAEELYRASVASFRLGKAVIKLETSKAVALNLPPALSETISHLPVLGDRRSIALVCSNFSCRPPISDPKELAEAC
ncbi:MAG: thioredoxin domain-containing protein [Terriglobales bacterium]